MSVSQSGQSPSLLDGWLKQKNIWGQFLRRWRRFYYGVFRKDYIARSITETRTGSCNRCGSCCKLVYNCPFLGSDVYNLPYCRIYGDLRPVNCHTYPFDKADSEVEICGFKFKDENPQG